MGDIRKTIAEEVTTPKVAVGIVTNGNLTAVSDNLLKNLNLNDGVHPDTSERRIYGPAQFVMEMLDDENNYRNLSGLQLTNYEAFGLYTHSNNTLPQGLYHKIITLQGKEDAYKELLGLIQKETGEIFKENDQSNYTKSNEEFWITKIKKGMEELNTHHNDSDFNKTYNDWMYNILYLLHESFGEAYRKKYGEYYRTEQEKTDIEAAKVRSKNITVK